MARARSIDMYIRRLYINELSDIGISFLIVLAIASAWFTFSSKLMLPFWFLISEYPLYMVIIFIFFSLAYLIWRLSRIRRNVGQIIWSILCPQCNNFISLHTWECPEPCNKTHIERSILEGCPDCGTRYKTSGADALTYTVCDACGHEVHFSDPYIFKRWSVLSKGDTWDSETIVIKNTSLFSILGTWFVIIGIALLLFAEIENIIARPLRPFHYVWDYVLLLALGVVFLLIHAVFYKRKKRIPNTTYKPEKEPEYLSVINVSFARTYVMILGLLLTFIGLAWQLYLLRTKLFYTYGSTTGDVITFTSNEIGIGIAVLIAGLALLSICKIFFLEYVQIKNPNYKEGLNGSSR